MKPLIQLSRIRRLAGFTLIELLVVIAIIAILAGLLLPAANAVRNKTTLNRVQGEVGQIKVAIESYQTDKGFYPPDNKIVNNGIVTVFPYPNALYYELIGATVSGNNNDRFSTVDSSVSLTSAQLQNAFGIVGINNAGREGDSEGPATTDYLPEIKPSQHGSANINGVSVQILGTFVDGPVVYGDINPFRYVSSNPTNNTSTFDLWVDVIVGGKTNRISNWSDKPEILN